MSLTSKELSSSRFRVIAFGLLFCAIAAAPQTQNQAQSAPSQRATPFNPPRQVESSSPPPPMRYVPGLAEPLVATGPVTAQETDALKDALAAFHDAPAKSGPGGDFDDYSRPLLAFITSHPASNWDASLYLDIGLGFYHAGYYSRTFTYFENSWRLGQDATSIPAKRMADRALGELAEMHARLGQEEELEALFAEVRGRPLSSAATFMMEGAHDGLETFQHRPEVAYLCGPAALKNVLLRLNATPAQVKVADDARSGPRGFSLSQLAALSDKAGLKYTLIYRAPGQPVPVPSIINWKVHHYAALIDTEDGRYRLQDPTFGNAGSVVSAKAVDDESSGYFLVPGNVVAQHPENGWRVVAANSAEAGAVYGMGNTFNALPGCVTCADRSTTPINAGQGGSSTPQMTLASASMAKASLTLTDTPVGYRPQKGLPSLVTIRYNAGDGDQPGSFSFSNLGPLWSHSWQAYIQDDPNNPGSNVKRIAGGGGGYDYDVLAQLNQSIYNSSTGYFTAETYDNSQLMRIPATGSATSYVRNMPDGGQETYALSNGATTWPRIMFLTAVTDPAGNETTLNYDSHFRLTSIIDAMGRKTTFQYGLGNLLITRIIDPFGRYSQLNYNSDTGQLVSITDPIGITSSFVYGSPSETDFITSLTTPYGTSKFSDTLDPGVPRTSYLELSIAMTDPLNNVEYLHVYQNQGVTGTGSEQYVPSGMTNDNSFLQWRNTYYWDAHEAANGGVTTDGNGNPTAETFTNPDIYHWFHQCCTINYLSAQLGSHKRPLEQYREWYNTNPLSGQDTGYYSGTFDGPTYIGRVLDVVGNSPVTQLTAATYNSLGRLLTFADPVNRMTQYSYAGNNIDLLTVSQLTAPSTYTTIATFGNYNSQHEPGSYTGPDGQTWNYTYNVAGQLQTVTDPNAGVTTYNYDSLGRLSTVVDANNVRVLTLTYDNADRVATRTDSQGYRLTYGYDKLDRVTTITYPDGTTDLYNYNFQSGPQAGKPSLDLRKHTDRLGRVTTYNYDPDRRLISVTEETASGQTRTTRYDYYENGTLKDIIDAKGNDTHWEIDLESRPTSKTYAYGTSKAQTETYEYEPDTPRLLSVTDALSQVKTYSYAPDNRLTGITYTGAINSTPNVTFAWDPYFPRLSSMTDGTGTTNYGYTAIGTDGALKLASVDGPYNNDTINLIYDALGRLATRSIPGGDETFAYDPISRLTSHGTPLGTFAYGYLGETEQTTSRSVTNGPKTIATRWSYDTNTNDRRLLQISNSGVTRTYALNYLLSGGGNNPYDIMNITDTAAKGHPFTSQTHSYTYDSVDRLLGATGSVTGNFSYLYDPLDNATTVSTPTGTTDATYDKLNQLATWGADDYAYDADGNTLSGDGTRTYKWDAENRLVEIDYVQTGYKTQFAYDGLGHRVSVTETCDGVMTTRYLWCGDAICQDRDQNDNVLSRDLDEGEYNAGTGQKLVYMPDQLGSVRDVLDGTTGALVAATDFTPYGAVGQTYGTTTTDYRYANLLYHTDSGLNLSATRPQDGVTGRWLGRDPTREAGGVNLYAYVGGNPINGIDPRGLVDLIVSGGFHAPLSPGVAVGKTQTYVLYTNNQHVNTGLEDPTNEAELGTIADAGINFGVRDISGTNGQCAGVTINYGLGKYFGFSITHRLFQDTSLSIFNPYRYIDGVTLNIGFGANIFASPVSISGPI